MVYIIQSLNAWYNNSKQIPNLSNNNETNIHYDQRKQFTKIKRHTTSSYKPKTIIQIALA